MVKNKNNNGPWSARLIGSTFSIALMFLMRTLEQFFNMKTYDLSAPWFYVLFALVLAEAIIVLFWSFLSLPPKKSEKTLHVRGIYVFIRHPIYTIIIFHLNVLFSLWWGSFLLLFLIPIQYFFWSKIIIREEQYLVGIFGEEYINYMSNVSRFIPWR